MVVVSPILYPVEHWYRTATPYLRNRAFRIPLIRPSRTEAVA
jgi:hypothetical protein